jgi:hypothetical protein
MSNPLATALAVKPVSGVDECIAAVELPLACGYVIFKAARILGAISVGVIGK